MPLCSHIGAMSIVPCSFLIPHACGVAGGLSTAVASSLASALSSGNGAASATAVSQAVALVRDG